MAQRTSEQSRGPLVPRRAHGVRELIERARRVVGLTAREQRARRELSRTHGSLHAHAVRLAREVASQKKIR